MEKTNEEIIEELKRINNNLIFFSDQTEFNAVIYQKIDELNKKLDEINLKLTSKLEDKPKLPDIPDGKD